jgi:RNA recognition motif-containing protein
METIYISSLPFKADADYIRNLFSPFGTVRNVELHADWVRPTYEPYALVEIETDDVKKVVDSLDGKKIGRTYIRVHKRTA